LVVHQWETAFLALYVRDLNHMDIDLLITMANSVIFKCVAIQSIACACLITFLQSSAYRS